MQKSITFICYPKCTTCKKAQAFLDANNIAYELRDIKENSPSYDELKLWYEKSGAPLKKFFNTSGLIYKNEGIKDKLALMSEQQQLELLATNGMLVKRPILVSDSFVFVGFAEDKWREALIK